MEGFSIFLGNVDGDKNPTVKDLEIMKEIYTSTNFTPGEYKKITSFQFEKAKVELEKGEKSKLNLVVVPIDTTDSLLGTWQSSNPSAVSVDFSGNITANDYGTSTITVTLFSGKVATCEVTVLERPIIEVQLNQENLNLEKGNISTLIATILPSNTTSEQTLTWKSNNLSVATVDNNGKVTAKGAGTAVITVTTSNGKKKECKVTVVEKTLKLNKTSLYLVKTKSENLQVTKYPEDTTLNWSSSNTKVAIVDGNGKVTAIKSGTSTITVRGSNGLTAVVIVTVGDNLRGDVNQDGAVNIKDAMEIMYIVTKRKALTDYISVNGDLINDHSINVKDAMEIMYIVTKRKTLQ